MDSWGFLHYFSLSMCSELYRCNLGVSLSSSLAPHFCIYACVFGYLFDPFIRRQILFPSFRRGIKATRDHGYAVCSDFLWLADECDCVCVCVSHSRIVGKRFGMHEIPGIVFFQCGQIQQAFQHCLFPHQERADERAKYFGKHRVVSFSRCRIFFLPCVSKLNMRTSLCTPAEELCLISAIIKSQRAQSL